MFNLGELESVESGQPNGNDYIKSCCAALYESDWAKLILGDSFHPGGLALTEKLGLMLDLRPRQKVLDVASGIGGSAMYLAERFGCEVVGVDFGAESVAQANRAAAETGLSGQVQFKQGDAEDLPFDSGQFDIVFSECAFCTFPNKQQAAAEFARVLKPNGRLGLSDLTRSGPLPPELDSLLGWIACMADAQPVEDYLNYLQTAGFTIHETSLHPEALSQMVREIQGRLFGAELFLKLKKVPLPEIDFVEARKVASIAVRSIRNGRLSYILIAAEKEVADRLIESGHHKH